MRNPNARPIEWCDFRKHKRFLIDTNVWIYLNGPQVKEDDKSRRYSDALKKIKSAQCEVFVDVVVLCEFVNRYMQIKLQAWKPPGVKVTAKDFRRSSEWPAVAKGITNAVREILKTCQRIDSGLESIDMEALLTDFERNRRDFNDQILAELCRSKNLMLITHDGDFKGYDITVFTANRQMLEPDDMSTNETARPADSH